MYVCVNCENTFYKPEVIEERHGFSYPPFEEYRVCPCCGGDYTVANTCKICGEYIIDDFILLKDGSTICSDCYLSCSIFDLEG